MGLKARFLTIFIFMALIFGGAIFATLHNFNKQKDDGKFINKAGRQRMLSQKMTKAAFAYKAFGDSKYLDEMKESKELFDRSLNELGESGFDTSEVSSLWGDFKSNLYVIADESKSVDEKTSSYEFISMRNQELLKKSNALVQVIVAESQSKVTFLKFILWGSAGLFALMLLVSFVYINHIMKPVKNVLDTMRHGAVKAQSTADHVNDSSTKLSSTTSEQAAAIQETASTLDEINAMVGRGVEIASKTRAVSDESRKAANEGKSSMGAMLTSIEDISNSNTVIMEEINNSNDKISEIVDVITEISNKTQVINDIVFQTKLLSFNASVEAARAGEHGKGFAVVAEEVGNLAEMSGDAAKEIGEMLNGSISRVQIIVEETKSKVNELVSSGKEKIESGVGIAQRCEEILEEVFRNIETVDEMMKDISTASKEQAEGVNNISTAMGQLDQAIQVSAGVAEENSDSSAQMSQYSGELIVSVQRLQSTLFGGDLAAEGPSVAEIDEPSSYSEPIRQQFELTPTQSEMPKRVIQEKPIELAVKKEEKEKVEKTSVEPAMAKVSGDDFPDFDDDRFEEF